MNMPQYNQPHDLLKLYTNPETNSISKFCDVMGRLDPKDLTDAYHRLRESAPHRHERDKSYFVGHSGITSSGKASNRREEHLAVALFNASQEGVPLKLPDGSSLKFLDYQLPLKARQGDKGIGKVDLFGVINGTQSSVIELKIHPSGTGYGDTPLRAFLEALAYCAIVEANADGIASEALNNFNLKLNVTRPSLIVLAPEEYWSGYINHDKSGDWQLALALLGSQLTESLGLDSHFIALRDSSFSMGLNGEKPQLMGECSSVYVEGLINQ